MHLAKSLKKYSKNEDIASNGLLNNCILGYMLYFRYVKQRPIHLVEIIVHFFESKSVALLFSI